MGELCVGDWIVDGSRNEIRRAGEAVRLEPKAIEVLEMLARHPGRVMGREELLGALWPGVIVGDDTLTQAVIKLRKALGDDAHRPRYIETVSKRGYRLIARVSDGSHEAAPGTFWRHWRAALAIAGAVTGMVVVGILLAPGIASRLQMPWPIAAERKSWLAGVASPTIAVLPLTNLSGDASRDYFSDGLTEDIINALGRFSALRVMSRGAVEQFRTPLATPQAIRSALGARYILKGSVRESGGRVRVSVELSDAERGALLWSERHEGEGKEVFEIQDRIVRNIVGSLAVKVTALERARAASKPPASLEAYDLVLQARHLIYRLTRETNREARVMLARATQLAPDYGEAWVTLAHAEYRRADQGWMEDPQEGMRRVEAHARRALSLEDPGARARAHAQLARVHVQSGNFEQALDDANRAIELNPSDPVAQYAQGSVLIWMGRTDEGVAALETMRRFDPSLDDLMLPLGYYLQGRYRDALAHTESRIARSPEAPFLHAVRVATLGQMQRSSEAAEAVVQLRHVAPFAKAELFGTNLRVPHQLEKFHEGLRKAGM